jgi:AcrR family transcriptional regulator
MTAPESRISRRRSAARSDANRAYTARLEDIILAGAQVFKEKGYEASTLNDIASKLGTDRASLYYYVGSKAELFQEVVKGVISQNVLDADAILAIDDTPRAKLRMLMDRLLNSYDKNYPYTYVYIQEDMRRIGEDDSEWEEEMLRQTKRLEHVAIQLIEQGQREGYFNPEIPTTIAANAFFGMLNWTHRWYTPSHRNSANSIVDAFSTIFLDGMSSRRPPTSDESARRPVGAHESSVGMIDVRVDGL